MHKVFFSWWRRVYVGFTV